MIQAIKQRLEEVERALKALGDADVRRDVGAAVDPPAYVIGPPSLRWEAIGSASSVGSSSMRVFVYVIEVADELAVERLWTRVPAVGAAIDEHVLDAVVISAEPDTFITGQTQLPCYRVELEMSLA